MAAGERKHPPVAGYPRCVAEDKALGAAAVGTGSCSCSPWGYASQGLWKAVTRCPSCSVQVPSAGLRVEHCPESPREAGVIAEGM